MKIFSLVTEAFGGFGGIAQFNRDCLNALSDMPFVERIVVLPRLQENNIGASDIPSDKLIQLPARTSKLSYFFHAIKVSKQESFDLIWCGHVNLIPVATCLSKKTGVSVWLSIHGIDAWSVSLSKAQTAYLSLVTAVSRYTRYRFMRNNPVDAARIKILPNTLSEIFTPGNPSPDFLNRYGMSNERRTSVLLTVSRLSAAEQYKGHDRVIDVIPKLLSKRPALRYFIVGDGDDRDRLQRKAGDMNLQDIVTFVGRVSDQELVEWFRLADLFVMPSTGEGFGIVFLQAAACGCAVVGGNQDGSSDALRDGKVGSVIDPINEEELASTILKQLEFPVMGELPAECFRYRYFQAHLEKLLLEQF